ncbi:hypothetical protein MKW92_032050 [Papaver armeniacum]|nr:hypothetical protein MKW92_032050 [Papaver armeniacum]
MKISSTSSFEDQCHENPIRVLGIRTEDNFDSKIFDSLSCCHNLHQLNLDGRLDVLNLQKYPPNLSELTLSNIKLEKDPMETLQYLPNLKLLELYDAFTGEEMVMLPEGLRFITTLKKLRIDSHMKTIKERVAREVGEDWYKVQHIPSLIVSPY